MDAGQSEGQSAWILGVLSELFFFCPFFFPFFLYFFTAVCTLHYTTYAGSLPPFSSFIALFFYFLFFWFATTRLSTQWHGMARHGTAHIQTGWDGDGDMHATTPPQKERKEQQRSENILGRYSTRWWWLFRRCATRGRDDYCAVGCVDAYLGYAAEGDGKIGLGVLVPLEEMWLFVGA